MDQTARISQSEVFRPEFVGAGTAALKVKPCFSFRSGEDKIQSGASPVRRYAGRIREFWSKGLLNMRPTVVLTNLTYVRSPKLVIAEKNFNVERQLSIVIKVNESYLPGEETEAEVTVTYQVGKPA